MQAGRQRPDGRGRLVGQDAGLAAADQDQVHRTEGGQFVLPHGGVAPPADQQIAHQQAPRRGPRRRPAEAPDIGDHRQPSRL